MILTPLLWLKLLPQQCPITDEKTGSGRGSAANVLAGVLLWISDHPTEQKTLASARESSPRAARIHHRCMFLVDEFGSIGHIADVPRDIVIMAGYGLDLTLIVQGLDQLKHHYGEGRR